MFFKLILFALIALLSVCTLARQSQQEQPFRVVEAIGRKDYSGFSGAGISKSYELKLVGADKKGIQFDSVWVSGKYIEPRVQYIEDTTLLQFGYSEPYQPVGEAHKDTVTYLPSPVADFKGEALIIYSTGSNHKYFPFNGVIQWISVERP